MLVAIDRDDKTLTNTVIILLVLLIVIPIVLVAVAALAGTRGDGDFGMMDWWGGGMGLMMIVPGGVVLLIIIVLLLAIFERPGQVQPAPPQYYPQYQPPAVIEPQALLDRRLASGEITVEEYNHIRQTLAKR